MAWHGMAWHGMAWYAREAPGRPVLQPHATGRARQPCYGPHHNHHRHHAGEPGAGKSQLALQALVSAQLPQLGGGGAPGGRPGSAVWIYTEGKPPLKRLRQLVDGANTRFGHCGAACSTDHVLLQVS
jgi:hypothetical protein